MVRALATQVGSGPAAELVIDEGGQLVTRAQIPTRPRLQEGADPDRWADRLF
jgi:hypothetical protein